MSEEIKIRWGWLKAMYVYTIAVAGFLGVGIIVMPGMIRTKLPWPVEEPTAFGVIGSMYAACGLLAILGLRSPLKFVPLLLLQLFYKSAWLVGVALPLWASERFPVYALPMAIIFATFIVGDLIAIPFSHVFAKEPKR